MSRLFKFRVWDHRLNKYINWNSIIPFDSKEYTIEQFTGLSDKNNKEVYDGDIVKCYNSIVKVEYGNWNCGCCSCVYGYEFDDSKEFEIIGNSFENPELLNKSN